MGDRYLISIECAYCRAKNDSIYYAPTCGLATFQCDNCDQYNFITQDWVALPTESIVDQDVIDGFLAETSIGWDKANLVELISDLRKDAERIRGLNKNG